MSDHYFGEWDEFYPPKEEPKEDIGAIICDDGPGGPGEITRERGREQPQPENIGI